MNLRKALTLALLALAFLTPAADAALGSARHSHATVLLPNGDFMVVGGVVDQNDTPTTSVEIYSMAAAAWGSGGSLTTARSSHTATLMSDGRVLVAGGFNNGTPVQTAEVYNTLTKTWANLGAAMVSARGGHSATLLNKGTYAGYVMICGGQTGAITAITASCELFNPQGDSFSAFGQMTSPRMGHTASMLPNGKVFASGGIAYSGGFIYLPTNEIFIPETNQWNPAAALLEGRIRHSATVLNNGNVLIAGGVNSVDQADQFSADSAGVQTRQNQGTKGYLESVEMFDPYGARLPLSGEDFDVMPYRNSSHAATLTPDSKLHLTGGRGNIPVSYIPGSASVPLGDAMTLNVVPTATPGIGAITGGTIPLQYYVELSRKVTGRITNGNIYFSLPPVSTDPSLKIGDVEFYLGRTTVTLDTFSIRKDITTGDGGWLIDQIDLPAPITNGTVVYPTFEASGSGNVVSSSFDFPGPLAESEKADLYHTSVMTLNNLTLEVPAIYNEGQLTCSGHLNSGTIANADELYTISLTTGLTSFTTGIVSNGLVNVNNVAFTRVGGIITNTTDYNLVTGLNTAGDSISNLTFALDCTGTFIRLYATELQPISFTADVSTVVIRDMIFSDDLAYSPSSSEWVFDKRVYLNALGSLVNSTPKFDHSTMLTPAADQIDIGGRNCEANVAAYCPRGSLRLDPIDEIRTVIFQNNAWTDGPVLSANRAAHTSTLLPDGTILTCGGSDGARTLQSCELLTGNSWTAVGAMVYPRSAHTATLLPNGSVLMAGGTTGVSTAAVKTAEIYYPDTHRFVLTAPMNEARMNHTATLLPDGNVLLVAGSSGTAYSGTSEVYITTAAKWQVIADPLATARSQHTATLLKNGRVMITGGIAGLGAVNSVEIYDPLTRLWSNAPSTLLTKRYAHSANLLRDGRVMVAGGSDGLQGLKTAEIFDGTNWTYSSDFPSADASNDMTTSRANHTSTLLPNGKVLITGGEGPSVSRGFAEGFDVDFSTWQSQGTMPKRTNHTTVLRHDGSVINIGGFSGTAFLATTDISYFSFTPDIYGRTSAIPRQPTISTGTLLFDAGDRVTLISYATNYHGLTEASGGGAGAMNSSFYSPRVYMQQIDNPSGFLTDMTTRLYTLYGGPNTNWETTLSSITVITPTNRAEIPWGWYNMRIASNGQFSSGKIVQVTTPRPTDTPSAPTGAVLGTSSITWTWTQGTVAAADGYNVFSSSDDLFITTTAFTPTASYTQTMLAPNTGVSIKVGVYNLGGNGPLARSATYYTLASSPTALTVTNSSFETASLSWDRNNNSAGTPFEVSMCAGSDFADPVRISTPVPFNLLYTSTFTTVDRLLTDTRYYFRVRARNGAGVLTDFSNRPSTLTVSNVGTLTGTSTSSSTINWAWNAALGADFYEIYDVTLDTVNPVFVGSTTYTDFTQTGLLPNRPYSVITRAVNNDPAPVYGPMSPSGVVYTLAGAPAPDPGNIFTNVSTGSFTANWLINDNSTWTVYGVSISSSDLYVSSSTGYATVIGDSYNFSGLAANFHYYVKVAAINGNGLASDEVALGSKYTLARAPAQVTPATVSISGVTITWSRNNNSDGTIYELRGTTDSFTGAVTTYLPFSLGYTGNSYTLTGLLTSTTYYFDVTARNGEDILTSRTQAVPAAFTDDKFTSAPAGSIAGTTDPARTVTITGTLPNSRTVSLTVPAGSFPAATAIAISSSATNACGSYLINSRTVEVAVYTQNNAQPQEPVTLSVSYDGFIIPSSDIYSLVLARYNPDSGQCLPLETRIDPGLKTITATLNHFSVFQLVLRTAATNLNDVLVYPNPFKPNRGNGFVTVTNLPASAKLRIYTLSGTKVWEGTAGTAGMIIWRGLNDAGNLVASGVYLAVVDSSVGKKVLKLAVER